MLAQDVRDLDGGQEILSRRIGRLEDALHALVDGVYSPAAAAGEAKRILNAEL